MIKNRGFNEDRTFGIEIEFFFNDCNKTARDLAETLTEAGVPTQFMGYTHETTRHWKIVTDASVNYEGLELVSPPIKGQEGLEEVKIVSEVLREYGVKVDASCGLHVHHDAGDFNKKTFASLFALYFRYEEAIDMMMPPSRRSNRNSYCEGFQGYDIERLKTIDIERLFGRYFKLNYHSYLRHGTVEFRQHSGTYEWQKINSWVVFTQMMVERAVTGTIQISRGASDWFNLKKAVRGYAWMGADETQQEAIKFLNKRIKHFTKRENK